MFELLLFLALWVVVSFVAGLIAGYAGLCHRLLDKLVVLRQRRAILDAARREREASGQ